MQRYVWENAWRDIEVVITRRSWKPFVRKGAWVRIPLSPLTVYTELSDWFPVQNWISDSERNVIQPDAEVPKWLKGLPWKGSRSLTAAQGFKSLLLRSAKAESTLITEQHDQPWTILRISSEEQKPSKVWIFLNGQQACENPGSKHFNMRVWSWLRMNAGGVLNTCKSNEADWSFRTEIWLSGGRVSNAWVTCLIQGDNS